MIISHKHKFIFIMPPKTAGTSLFNAIKSSLNTKEFLEENTHYHLNRYQAKNNKFYPNSYRHSLLEEAIKDFPCASNYLKFSFVRNPWDLVVSFYFYELKSNIISNHITFKDFIIKKFFNTPLCIPQFNYFKDPELMTFIGKFENLQEDFNFVCDKIGIPRQKLPHDNKTNHKHYTEYYDDETKQIVAERYARDIEYFRYQFGI